MSSEGDLSAIADGEPLARFVVFSKWVRQDNTVKQDAFIPPLDLELSVTRHVGLSFDELWQLGVDVAAERRLKLYGRADIKAARVRRQNLDALPDPPPKNHARIIGWPTDKPGQKLIALELARDAEFTAIPLDLLT